MRPIKNNYGKYYSLSLTKPELSMLLAALRQSNDMLEHAKTSYWQDLLALDGGYITSAEPHTQEETAAYMEKRQELNQNHQRVSEILAISAPLYTDMKAFYDEPATEAKK